MSPAGGVDGNLCAVILAAGEGRRLRPLTELLPKALCPVGNLPLLEHALRRVGGLGLVGPAAVAVNACYLGTQVVDHVGQRAHLSVEPAPPWGTAGGLARLRGWIAGRGVLVGNADAYLATAGVPPGEDIAALVAGWDGDTVRILGRPAVDGQRAEFGPFRFAGFSLLPWRYVAALEQRRGELVGTVWRPAEAAGELEVVPYDGTYLDTGTPETYLAANLHAAGAGNLIHPDATVTGDCQAAVVGAGAVVRGALTRAVVWPGGRVAEGERLHDAVRVGGELTVPAGARLA